MDEDGQNMSIEHEYKLWITLSESVIENFVQRPLAEESPRRHFRFARKRHDLGNHA